MKRKIFSILFALVLVLSFSLVTAVPVSANPGGIELVAIGDSTATWTTEQAKFGSYSVKLTMPAENWVGHNAEVKITFDSNPKVSEFSSWSYWAKPGPEGSYMLPTLIYTDADANADGRNDVIQCYVTGNLPSEWSEITNADIKAYAVFDVGGNIFKFYFDWDSVVTKYGGADVLSFRVGYGGLGSVQAKSAYVDDFTLNDTTYVFEPPPTKADILKESGVPGKGLDKAPGLQKPFNPDSKAGDNAGKK